MHWLEIVPPVVSALASGTFVALYSLHRWWERRMGWSVMALSVSLTVLAFGRVLVAMHPTWGLLINSTAYFAIAAVMIWRTYDMWTVNHPEREHRRWDREISGTLAPTDQEHGRG